MKQTLHWILVLVVACAICSLVTHRIAYHNGFVSGYRQGSVTGLTCGDFTESLLFLLPLQKLRAGDIPTATRLMETTCFGRANAFLKYPTPVAGEAGQWVKTQGLLQSPGTAMARALAKGLWEYRAAYRTNSADWDDTERQLEVEIAKVKSDDYKAWANLVVMPTVASPYTTTKPTPTSP
jgi:hypothetical protein